MRKKTRSSLAALATAAIIAIGSLIAYYGGDSLPLNLPASGSITQGAAQDSSLGNAPDRGAARDSTEQEQKGTGESRIFFPDTIVKAEKEGITPFGYIDAAVTEVTDGDTFHISYDGQEYKVRMLDIDTPESVKSGVKPQPYSKEASERTKNSLEGKTVRLVFEKGITDQFGRLLAHVILEDNTYYNAFMVQNGYAICVFYSPNTLLKKYFTELQDTAIESGTGFWKLAEKERPFIKDKSGKYVAAYKIKDKAA